MIQGGGEHWWQQKPVAWGLGFPQLFFALRCQRCLAPFSKDDDTDAGEILNSEHDQFYRIGEILDGVLV